MTPGTGRDLGVLAPSPVLTNSPLKPVCRRKGKRSIEDDEEGDGERRGKCHDAPL